MDVDRVAGPLLLEINARPGLMIQLANRAGLLPRLRAIDREITPGLSAAERIAVAISIARCALAAA